jgi:hypothetical protein
LLLRLFLDCFKAPGLIFLEEDLEIAPDFFTYFEATTPLMERDSSIYCVSAWNDHGQRGRVKDNRALYRTDIIPGLGWYINSKIGLELALKWPITNWDDWMRLPGVKNGRSCIFPEVGSMERSLEVRCDAGKTYPGCIMLGWELFSLVKAPAPDSLQIQVRSRCQHRRPVSFAQDLCMLSGSHTTKCTRARAVNPKHDVHILPPSLIVTRVLSGRIVQQQI